MPNILAILVLASGSWIHIAGGTWDPSAAVMRDVISQTEPYAEAQAIRFHESLAPWSTYTIQYQGRTVKGAQLLYINAFCFEPPEDAAEGMVFISDGGACVFEALYDPSSKQFVSFTFHGHG